MVGGLLCGIALAFGLKRPEAFFAGLIWFCAFFVAGAAALARKQFLALHKSRHYYLASCNLAYQSAFVTVPPALVLLLLQLLTHGRHSIHEQTLLLDKLPGLVIFGAGVALLAGVISMLATRVVEPLVAAAAERLTEEESGGRMIVTYVFSFAWIGAIAALLTILLHAGR
jgi:hypothetical protein